MVPRSTQLPQRSGRRVPESPRQALNRLVRRLRPSATLGADTGYDTGDFITAFCGGVTPHIAQNTTTGAVP